MSKITDFIEEKYLIFISECTVNIIEDEINSDDYDFLDVKWISIIKN